MARALSTSVFAPLVMPSAILRTMPSVGISSVGAVKNFRSAADRSSELSGREKSTARSRVMKRLVTSIYGLASRAGHSAYSIATPYLPSCRTCARDALALQLEPIVAASERQLVEIRRGRMNIGTCDVILGLHEFQELRRDHRRAHARGIRARPHSRRGLCAGAGRRRARRSGHFV